MKFVNYIFLIFSVSALPSCGTTNKNIFFHSRNVPDHVVYAIGYLGLHEHKDREQLHNLVGVDPVQTEWCAAFLNAILENQNIAGSDSVSNNPLMARSFLSWGDTVAVPQIGDIMIFKRGNNSWQGHVAIYLDTVKKNNKTYYKILGGNQDDSVTISYYPTDLLISARRIESPLLKS